MQRRLIRTIPSPDAGFQAHVERLLTRFPAATPDAFEARLRRLFPRATVRPRVLSGEPSAVWYVYRDGSWRPPEASPWWEAGSAARVVLDTDGWIEDANTAALGLLGIPDVTTEPRHVTDFVMPGTLDDVTSLWAIVAGGVGLAATVLLRSAHGDAIACDVHAALAAGRVVVHLRLAEDIATTSAPLPAPTAIDCWPASDAAFRADADAALARMPEPTVEGLAMRLRRRYPHARVEAGAGSGAWQVLRDGMDDAGLRADGETAAEAPTGGAAVAASGTGAIRDVTAPPAPEVEEAPGPLPGLDLLGSGVAATT